MCRWLGHPYFLVVVAHDDKNSIAARAVTCAVRLMIDIKRIEKTFLKVIVI